MTKYYVIIRRIDGTLSRVYRCNTKKQVNALVNEFMDLAYQVTTVCAAAFATGDNLQDARNYLNKVFAV